MVQYFHIIKEGFSMPKEVVIFCMTGTKSIKKKADSLSVLGWEHYEPSEYSYLLSHGVKNPQFNIQAKYIYMSVDRPFDDEIEQADVEMIDVYFNGELIISCDGVLDEDCKSILISDYKHVITEYYFNRQMWDELVIIRSKNK